MAVKIKTTNETTYVKIPIEVYKTDLETLKHAAKTNGVSLNQFISDACSLYLLDLRDKEIEQLRQRLKTYEL